MKAAVLAIAALATSVPTADQTFKTATELVTVPVTVTNRRGGDRKAGLGAADFRVTEDGVEQPITVVDQERYALSLCIVLDASSSMMGDRDLKARSAVQATLNALLPDDEVTLLVFAKEVVHGLPWTPARELGPIDWSGYQLSDGTVLNDALKAALASLEQARNPRTAILLVSDGEELDSRTRLPDLVTTRRQSEALVYAFRPDVPKPDRMLVSPGAGPMRGAGSAAFGDQPVVLNVLPDLVGDSGGVVFPVRDDGRTAAAALVDELRYLYAIGYVPAKPADGKYRRIKVEARNKDFRVRHRAGYLALPK